MYWLYQKKEILFAILWIVIYCVLLAPLKGTYGNDSLPMLAGLTAIAVILTVFVKRHHLEERYGLHRWPDNTKRFLYFIPMWFLATGNLWGGITMRYSPSAQLTAILSMCLIGYIEELIFRGFLFQAMASSGSLKTAVIVASITFGIGHIVNLLAGQTSLETLIQVPFAIVWGFIFTMVFLKSGSLWPCILAHALIDIFAEICTDNLTAGYVYIAATIVLGIAYCLYLNRLPNSKNIGTENIGH